MRYHTNCQPYWPKIGWVMAKKRMPIYVIIVNFRDFLAHNSAKYQYFSMRPSLKFARLKFAGQVMWLKFEITPVSKLNKLSTSNFLCMFLVVLTRSTERVNSMTAIILAQGYAQFSVTWLARQISNERTIITEGQGQVHFLFMLSAYAPLYITLKIF